MKTKRIFVIFSWFLYTIINSVTIDIINTVIIVSHLGLLWLHSPIKCLRLQSGSLAYSLLLIESVIENMRMGVLMMLIEMMAYVRILTIGPPPPSGELELGRALVVPGIQQIKLFSGTLLISRCIQVLCLYIFLISL